MDTIKSFSLKATLWRIILAVTVLCTLLALVLQVNAQTESCIQSLAGNGTYNGTWDNSCLSENTPLGDYSFPSGTRYARFYTFTLGVPSTVTVELKSSTDTYMYLMQGTGKTGNIEHYNDDVVVSEDTNSRISESLPAGDYTIEATTYDVEASGNFTLTVSGFPDASTPTVGAEDTPTVMPTPTTTPVSRQPTPTITPTPARTTVPTDVLNRLSALETRVATQNGLISTLESKVTALDSRVATLEADATPAPIPTTTPEPVSTPTPEPTPTPTPDLGTLANPIPLRQTFRPPDSPWELRVASVDWDAWPEIQAENRFNDPPASGNKFVMIEIAVRNRGSAADSFQSYNISSVGNRAVEYRTFTNDCGVIPDDFEDFTRIFPGGSLQGNICYEVALSDLNSLLLFGDRRTFGIDDFNVDTLWFWKLR